jgi:hypothetical protein
MKEKYLEDAVLTGRLASEEITFQYAEYDRQARVSVKVWPISKSSELLQSEYNGFIGIKPVFSLGEAEKNENLIYKAKQDGVIDHMVVSFYTDVKEGNHSIIKVGGWDQIAIQENNELTMLQCVDQSSWRLTTA